MAPLVGQPALGLGSCAVGLLLTGMPQPLFHAVLQRTQRLTAVPLVELEFRVLDTAARQGPSARRALPGTTPGLRCFAILRARRLECAERDEPDQPEILVVMTAQLVEQTALDVGRYAAGLLPTGLLQPPLRTVAQHTRHLPTVPTAAGWLLTGLPQPPFHAVQQPKQHLQAHRPQASPATPDAAARPP